MLKRKTKKDEFLKIKTESIYSNLTVLDDEITDWFKNREVKEFYEDDMEIRLYVEGQRKADAFTKLLPAQKILGNVCVKIAVVPEDIAEKNSTLAELFEDAFDGNEAFTETYVADVFASNPITYVMFEPEVVQYWNDNLGDPHGNIATLYQDIAREVFSGGIGGNANFSTDLPE